LSDREHRVGTRPTERKLHAASTGARTIRRALILLALGLVTSLAAVPAMAGVNKWTTNGPFGGPAFVVAVDPKTPSTLYEASPGGGVFKSVDRGQSGSYAGSGNGIFMSTNGAASWTQVSSIVEPSCCDR
jgi:hypothetical protein